jgi:hypothetical protein
VTFGATIAFGTGALLHRVASTMLDRRVWIAVAAILVALPGAQLVNNWHTHDASSRYFAHDYARNALSELPPNAIYFTVGDNDTFPPLYLQAVEHVRPDVRLVNISLLFDATYVEQLLRADPTFPLSMTRNPRSVKPYRWGDSTLALPVSGTREALGLAPTTIISPTISLRPKPAFTDSMLLGDLALLDIVRTNAWRRPLTFAITVGQLPSWLAPFARLDGLHYRIVPIENAEPNAHTLRSNLLSRSFRGFADSAVIVDDVTRNMGHAYFRAFDALLDADEAAGSGEAAVTQCRADLSRILSLVPPSRIALGAEDQQKLQGRCK